MSILSTRIQKPFLFVAGVGIAAFAFAKVLPSFLNQSSKAQQSEAKSRIGAINRAQAAFFSVHNYFISYNELKNWVDSLSDSSGAKIFIGGSLPSFYPSCNELRLEDSDQGSICNNSISSYYYYDINVIERNRIVQSVAIPKERGLKSYTGIRKSIVNPSTGETTTIGILCVSKINGGFPPKVQAIDPSNEPICPDGYVNVE